ncbi:MAG: GreA/GreB family elongation factor [Thermoguttaceae bacterium]|jgi:transcription elongation factor GreA
MLMTTRGIEGLRKKIRQFDAECARALAQAGESAQNDPNQYHDNFEYEEGMRQHGMLGKRIADLLAILAQAVPAPTPVNTEAVCLGHVVKVRFLDDGETSEWLVCGDGEASLFENACSVTSELGQTLLGMRVGQRRSYRVPDRSITVEVLGIRIAEDQDFELQNLPFGGK